MMGIHSDPAGPAGHPAVAFRNYQPADLPELARMAKETWPSGPAVDSEALELSGMEGYVMHSLRQANWTDVAHTPEGIAGFLFARIDGYRGDARSRRSDLGETLALVRSYLRHGHMIPTLLGLLSSLILTDLKLKVLMPRSDASIEMFVVDPVHRGKGIGSNLLDRFLRVAGESGSELVALYTDDAASDWRFYDRRGFRKTATFHDNLSSHYLGTPARGIVYVLDLRERPTEDEARDAGRC